MRYLSVRDVRAYNGWHPYAEKQQPLKKIRQTLYQTPHAPLVDGNYDGSVIDDVEVFVDGEPVEPDSVDPDTGLISVYPPPSENIRVEANYFWHPVGDGEIVLAVEAAEGLVEALTGVVYVPHLRVERLQLLRGNLLSVSEPIIQIQSVKIFSRGGDLIDFDAEVEVVDASSGLIRLKNMKAEPTPPWYLPSPTEVEIRYVAGYGQTPQPVKQAVLLLASHNILLRLQHRITFASDYGNQITAAFTAQEIEKRLHIIKTQVEKILNTLPRRVEKA